MEELCSISDYQLDYLNLYLQRTLSYLGMICTSFCLCDKYVHICMNIHGFVIFIQQWNHCWREMDNQAWSDFTQWKQHCHCKSIFNYFLFIWNHWIINKSFDLATLERVDNNLTWISVVPRKCYTDTSNYLASCSWSLVVLLSQNEQCYLVTNINSPMLL